MFSMFSQNRQLKEETEMKKPLSSITEEQFQDIKTAILYSDEMINLFRHNTPDGKAKKKRKICWDYKERIWCQSACKNDPFLKRISVQN